MRRIIGGKVYDTSTARLIYSEGFPSNRREYYMTQKRAFFCYYKKTDKIVVMSEDEIKELLGEKDYDMYVELFGVPDMA